MYHKEAQLMKAAQEGRGQAFSEIYDLFYEPLLRFVLRKTSGQRELSEDIVSETFIKAVRHLHTFSAQEGKNPLSWFYRIADNELKMYWRKQHRYRFEALEDHPHLRSEHADAIDHVVSQEQRGIVQHALSFLSDSDRQLIERHYFEYIALVEIASEQNRSVGAIKTKIHRARKKLRTHIEKQHALAMAADSNNDPL